MGARRGVLEPGHSPPPIDQRSDFWADKRVVPCSAMVVGDVGPHVQKASELGVEIDVVEPVDAGTERLEHAGGGFDGVAGFGMHQLEVLPGQPDAYAGHWIRRTRCKP